MTTFPSYQAINEYDVNLGTHDPFVNLADDSRLQLIYLIEAYPYDAAAINNQYAIMPYPGVLAIGEFQYKSSGAEKVIRLSQAGYITKPTDSVANRNYLGRVSDAIQIESNIFGNSNFGASQSFGGIEVINPDGQLDYFHELFWDDRDIIVKAGTKDFTYDQFTTIFKGKTSGIEANETRILLSLGDNRAQVNQVVKQGIYAGTGGAAGMVSIAGMYKPLMFGKVFNVRPKLVDYANQVYQLHDGAITSVQAVRDRGVVLTFNANVADVFLAAAPPPGTYNTSTATGMIRLGSTPAGDITVDAVGETAAGDMTGADLAVLILTTRLGIYNLDFNDIDVTGYAKNRIDSPYTQGIYIEDTTFGIDVLDALISSIDDYWTFTRQGKLTFGSPSIGVAEAKIKRINIEGVALKQTLPAAFQVDVNYAFNNFVQSNADLASPTDADRTFATNEYRNVTKSDAAVRTKNRQAIIRTFNTRVALQADANTLLNKLQERYASKRKVYTMRVYNPAYKYFLGDTVQLTHNRFGLEAGQSFLLTGISENASTNESQLTVWG